MLEKNLTLTDHARSRKINLQLYVPTVDEPMPAVIFSHGVGGSNTGYSYFGKYFSHRGILCLHPAHPGSDSSILAGKRFSENRNSIMAAIAEPENYRQPPQDIRFILDQLPAIEESISRKVDRARIALVGHSLGAFTTLTIAGASIPLFNERWRCADPRPSAFIALSPPHESARFDAESWSEVRGPLLTITGSNDEGLCGEAAALRVDAFRKARPGRKWMVVLKDAPHLSFTDPLPFNDRPAVRSAVQQLSFVFLDTLWQRQESELLRALAMVSDSYVLVA